MSLYWIGGAFFIFCIWVLAFSFKEIPLLFFLDDLFFKVIVFGTRGEALLGFFFTLFGDLNGLLGSSCSIFLTIVSISTFLFSKRSIKAYPKPGITYDCLCLFNKAGVSFLPEVIDNAKEAISLSFLANFCFWVVTNFEMTKPGFAIPGVPLFSSGLLPGIWLGILGLKVGPQYVIT